MPKYVFTSEDGDRAPIVITTNDDGYITDYEGVIALVGEHLDSQSQFIHPEFMISQVWLQYCETEAAEYIEDEDGAIIFRNLDDSSRYASPMVTKTVDFRDMFTQSFELRAFLDEHDNIIRYEGPVLNIADDYRRNYGMGLWDIANKLRLLPTEHPGEFTGPPQSQAIGGASMHDRDDSNGGEVAALASEFHAVANGSAVDREEAIRLLDMVGRLFTWRALRIQDRGGPYLDLCGGMEVYNLLEQGWGHTLYSGKTPDRFDELLFASLLAVMQATDRVMPPDADLNKRAYGAFGTHALHPTGGLLVDDHIRRLSWWTRLADEQADGGAR